MDIDMTILRSLEREKEITFDILVEAIEQALLTAYHKTPGAQPDARVELDRKTGHVTVLAAETDEEGNKVAEYDDTPDGFGRIAATTAKQVILQRLRDAEDDVKFGEFSGKEGDIVSGIIQQGRDPAGRAGRPRPARGAAAVGRAGAGGALRARHPDQVPGHQRAQGHARAAGDAVALATRTWSRSCSPSRCPRSPTAPWRSARSRARRGTAPRSRCARPSRASTPRASCIGPMGQRVRNVMHELHGEKIDIVDWSDDPAELVGHALSPARVSSVEVVDRRRARRG